MKLKTTIFIILLSLCFPISDIFLFEYTSNSEDYTPKLYGFPCIYRSQIPWVHSLEGQFYISGYILNVIFFFTALILISYGIKIIKLKNKILPLISKFIIIGIFILVILKTCLISWTFYWDESEIKSLNPNTTWNRSFQFFNLN